MSKLWRGFTAWCRNGLRKIPRQKTPLWIKVSVTESVLGSGDEASIASLKYHPGFIALLNKLARQRAVLESRLNSTRHHEIRDVDLLQSGLFWIGYVESEVNQAAGIEKRAAQKSATASEVEEFSKALAAIESVGVTSSEI